MQDRKPYKSSRSDRPRSRSPTPERDRRSHRSSDSRRHSDRRSRSRSPHRSRDSRASGGERRSERSEKPDRSEGSDRKDSSGTSSSSANATTSGAVSLPVHSIEALLDSVAPAATEELTAKRAAEQAVLEEEIRKRREKVNAWREAKRLQVEAEARANALEAPVASTNLNTTEAGNSTLEKGSSACQSDVVVERVDVKTSAEAANSDNHGWSLENDDEEEEKETELAPNASAMDRSESLSALSALPAPASPIHITSNDDVAEAAVFQNIAGTPVKSNTHAVHHHVQGFPLAHVTAVSLAAVVTGTSVGESKDEAQNDVQSSIGSMGVNAGAKRRMSRLKQSKWDSDSMDVENETSPTSTTANTLTHSTITATAASAVSTQPSKPTATAAVEEEEEEEVDPLEAFMTSLYDTGDVAVQKNLPSEVSICVISSPCEPFVLAVSHKMSV